jgi:hypothetical protein
MLTLCVIDGVFQRNATDCNIKVAGYQKRGFDVFVPDCNKAQYGIRRRTKSDRLEFEIAGGMSGRGARCGNYSRRERIVKTGAKDAKNRPAVPAWLCKRSCGIDMMRVARTRL